MKVEINSDHPTEKDDCIYSGLTIARESAATEAGGGWDGPGVPRGRPGPGDAGRVTGIGRPVWSVRRHTGLSLVAPKLEGPGGRNEDCCHHPPSPATFDLLDCHWRWGSGFLHSRPAAGWLPGPSLWALRGPPSGLQQLRLSPTSGRGLATGHFYMRSPKSSNTEKNQ